MAALDDGGHLVEVSGTDLLLVRNEGVATAGGGKFWLLYHLDVVLHSFATGVLVGQLVHVEPHVVDTRQGNELVLVTHVGERLLEAGDGGIVQILFPVGRERRPDHGR